MARSEGAGAFGEDGEDAARDEKLVATIQGFGIGGAVAIGIVFVAHNGDTGEEEAREEIFLELGGDEESGGRENGFVDPAIDGAVAVKCDDEGGAGDVRARGKDLDTREVGASAK